MRTEPLTLKASGVVSWPSLIPRCLAVVIALAALIGMTPDKGLKDRNADGVYRVTVIGDSLSANRPHGVNWVDLIQHEQSLVRMNVWRVAGWTSESVEWENPSFQGMSCAGELFGRRVPAALAESAIGNGADAIIVALGTNDLQRDHASADQIIGCFREIEALARRSNVPTFFATTPPVYPPYHDSLGDAEYWTAQTAHLNAAVRSSFDPRFVIDFDSGFSAEHYLPDGRHLNETGQHLRAERAVAALRAAE